MIMTNEKAINSVLKKLSAMRVTLQQEEQEFLDSLVITEIAGDEVAAHKMATKVSDKVIDKNVTALPEDVEVAAHRMTTKNVTKVSDKVIDKNVTALPEDDEVAAHRMTTKNVTKVSDKVIDKNVTARPDDDEVAAHRMTTKNVIGKVIFDPEKAIYRVLVF
jgi:hypothetical protein